MIPVSIIALKQLEQGLAFNGVFNLLCSLYTYREHNKYQTPLLSKPCSNCFSAILEAGISKIYYTTGEYPYYEYIKLKEVL